MRKKVLEFDDPDLAYSYEDTRAFSERRSEKAERRSSRLVQERSESGDLQM